MRYRYWQPVGGRLLDWIGHQSITSLPYTMVFEGDAETLDMVWATHNRDDRPRRREIRSMSIGDVVEVPDKGTWYVVEPIGWRLLEPDERAHVASLQPR